MALLKKVTICLSTHHQHETITDSDLERWSIIELWKECQQWLDQKKNLKLAYRGIWFSESLLNTNFVKYSDKFIQQRIKVLDGSFKMEEAGKVYKDWTKRQYPLYFYEISHSMQTTGNTHNVLATTVGVDSGKPDRKLITHHLTKLIITV